MSSVYVLRPAVLIVVAARRRRAVSRVLCSSIDYYLTRLACPAMCVCLPGELGVIGAPHLGEWAGKGTRLTDWNT